MISKILAVIAAAAVAGGIAYAGSSNTNYTSAGTVGFRTTTDGSTSCVGATPCNLANVTIWDSAAGANGLAVNASGQIGISNFPATQTVSGTVTANQGSPPWAVSGTVTANQGSPPWTFNASQWGGTAITNVPTAIGTVGTGNTPTFNSFLVGCISTVCNPNGQTTMSSSAPVVIASNQSPVPTTEANSAAILAAVTASIPSGNNTIGNVGLIPTTTGGLANYFVQPTASDNHANIKNGAGNVYKITVTNNSVTVNYLRLYNAGTGFAGCGAATNLVYQVAIPALTSVGGISDSWVQGLSFSTGISICVTSGYPTNDTTNATANAMSVNIGYN